MKFKKNGEWIYKELCKVTELMENSEYGKAHHIIDQIIWAMYDTRSTEVETVTIEGDDGSDDVPWLTQRDTRKSSPNGLC